MSEKESCPKRNNVTFFEWDVLARITQGEIREGGREHRTVASFFGRGDRGLGPGKGPLSVSQGLCAGP